ncbi:MAG: hypothetical protein ACH37Z_06750 [Anaerolineae bacterium]
MRPRRNFVPILTLISVVALTVAVVTALRPGPEPSTAALPADGASRFRLEGPDGPVEPVMKVISGAEYDRLPPLPVTKVEIPDSLDQGGCQRGGRIIRVDPVLGEGFESSPFPRPGGRWAISDLFSKSPGFLDEVGWGAVACEASVDKKSLWSVGGGSIGKTLKCDGSDKQYFTQLRGNKGIRTLLRYGVLDLNTNRGVGIRITFDYKAKMPDKALLVGVGDGNQRAVDGKVSYTGYNYFQADTQGEWVRGEIVAFANGSEYLTPVAGIANKDKIELAFFYTDPPNADGAATPGIGSPTAGMHGVFIDNLFIDVLIDPRPCPIGSPTATDDPVPPTPAVSDTPEDPTDTPRPTRTRKPTPPPFDVKTPTPRDRRAFLPVLSRSFDTLIDWTPPPPGKTATRTAIPTVTHTPLPPTPTETDEPTETPVPTRTRRPTVPPTPTYTPRPSATPKNFPQVIIADMIPYLTPGRFETVVLMNVGTGPQDLTGWHTVGASRGQKLCDLPAGRILAGGEAYEIRSGKDARPGMRDNPKFGTIDGFVCTEDFIWDNNQDQATLFDFDQIPVSKFCWDLEGPYICP